MSGYIEAGYIVVLGTLAVYAATLVRREQLARARLGMARRQRRRARRAGPEHSAS